MKVSTLVEAIFQHCRCAKGPTRTTHCLVYHWSALTTYAQVQFRWQFDIFKWLNFQHLLILNVTELGCSRCILLNLDTVLGYLPNIAVREEIKIIVMINIRIATMRLPLYWHAIIIIQRYTIKRFNVFRAGEISCTFGRSSTICMLYKNVTCLTRYNLLIQKTSILT